MMKVCAVGSRLYQGVSYPSLQTIKVPTLLPKLPTVTRLFNLGDMTPIHDSCRTQHGILKSQLHFCSKLSCSSISPLACARPVPYGIPAEADRPQPQGCFPEIVRLPTFHRFIEEGLQGLSIQQNSYGPIMAP